MFDMETSSDPLSFPPFYLSANRAGLLRAVYPFRRAPVPAAKQEHFILELSPRGCKPKRSLPHDSID